MQLLAKIIDSTHWEGFLLHIRHRLLHEITVRFSGQLETLYKKQKGSSYLSALVEIEVAVEKQRRSKMWTSTDDGDVNRVKNPQWFEDVMDTMELLKWFCERPLPRDSMTDDEQKAYLEASPIAVSQAICSLDAKFMSTKYQNHQHPYAGNTETNLIAVPPKSKGVNLCFLPGSSIDADHYICLSRDKEMKNLMGIAGG